MKRLLLILFLCSRKARMCLSIQLYSIANLSLIATIILIFSIVARSQFRGVKPILGTQIDWSHPLSRGLVGCWNFSEAGGNLVNDLSGNGNTGTITGATWTAGKFGPCLSFDGDADRVDLVPWAGGWSSFTISIWVYANTSNNGDTIFSYCPAFGFRSDGAIHLFWFSGANWVRFLVYNEAVTSAYQYTAVTPNAWNHIVGVYDGAYVRVYCNGVLGTATAPAALTGTVRAGVDRTVIGCDAAYSATKSWLGRLDDLQFWANRALSASEITQLYYDPFGMMVQDRPELYVAAEAPAGGGQFIMVSRAAVPFLIPLGVIVSMAWCMRKRTTA